MPIAGIPASNAQQSRARFYQLASRSDGAAILADRRVRRLLRLPIPRSACIRKGRRIAVLDARAAWFGCGLLVDLSAYTPTLVDDGLQESGSPVITPQKGNQLPAIR